ncbi:MAG: phosphatase PAP2 family protein [Anaerolineae bacterium]
MEIALQSGLDWLISLQQAGGDVAATFFKIVTFIGNQEFYLLMFPFLFWCLDTRLGVRVAVAYLVSTWFNVMIKEITMAPRPFEVNPAVGIIDEEGFGMPSNHAQASTMIFGVLAYHLKKPWGWAAMIVITILVGISRIYLGVHFPLQVVVGWTLGVLFLIGYINFLDQIEAWVLGRSLAQHLTFATVIALVGSLIMARPDIIATLAVLWGLWCGLASLKAFSIDFTADGTLWQKIGRFVLGGIVVIGLFGGLRALFPDEGESLYLIFRFVRYGSIGFFVGFIGPWLFTKLKLA